MGAGLGYLTRQAGLGLNAALVRLFDESLTINDAIRADQPQIRFLQRSPSQTR